MSKTGLPINTFVQGPPSKSWVINHNFGRPVIVTVLATLNGVLKPITPLAVQTSADQNTTTILFASPLFGEARIVGYDVVEPTTDYYVLLSEHEHDLNQVQSARQQISAEFTESLFVDPVTGETYGRYNGNVYANQNDIPEYMLLNERGLAISNKYTQSYRNYAPFANQIIAEISSPGGTGSINFSVPPGAGSYAPCGLYTWSEGTQPAGGCIQSNGSYLTTLHNGMKYDGPLAGVAYQKDSLGNLWAVTNDYQLPIGNGFKLVADPTSSFASTNGFAGSYPEGFFPIGAGGYTNGPLVVSGASRWRLLATQPSWEANFGTYLQIIREFSFYESTDGTGARIVGTASANTTPPQYPASNANDNNTITYWQNDPYGPNATIPTFWELEFASAATVRSIRMEAFNADSGYHAKEFALQSSPDGVTWTTKANVVTTKAGQLQLFSNLG